MAGRRTDTYRGLTVSAGLHATAEAMPSRPALGFGDRVLSYGELAARIRRVAGGIRALLGRTHGERAQLRRVSGARLWAVRCRRDRIHREPAKHVARA